MLRSITRTRIHAAEPLRRTLVSTVVLTKQYEEKTVAELKKEAQRRGLSQSGNKAALVSRIQTFDNRTGVEDPTPKPPTTPQSKRGMASAAPSSSVPPADTAVTGRAMPSAGSSAEVFHIFMPTITQPAEPPVQIPFVPDFWKSLEVNAAEGRNDPPFPSTSENPKVVIVGGASTHTHGAPIHGFDEADAIREAAARNSQAVSSAVQSAVAKTKDSFWADVASDLNIPTVLPNVAEVAEGVSSTTHERHRPKEMESEDKKGLYALLGLFVGSYAISKVVT